MTAVNTLVCWTLSSLANIWLVNTPAFTGDAEAFSIGLWKQPGFLDDPTNATNWARWVDSHWGSLFEPAGFVFGSSAELFSIAANNARNGQISLANETVLSNSKTISGEIWRVMSGWYVSVNQAVASWVGSDTCGAAPPTPTPEPTPTPTANGFVYYTVSKDPTADSIKTTIQFGYMDAATQKVAAGGKLFSEEFLGEGVLKVTAAKATEQGISLQATLGGETKRLALVGIFPTGITLEFDVAVDEGSYLTKIAPTGYTFRETSKKVTQMEGLYTLDSGLDAGFDSLQKKVGLTGQLGKLTNSGHGGWISQIKGDWGEVQIKANTDDPLRPIPWGAATEAWVKETEIFGNCPDTLANNQGSNPDGSWLSWSVGKNYWDDGYPAFLQNYRIEQWLGGKRTKTLAAGVLNFRGGGNPEKVTYKIGEEADELISEEVGLISLLAKGYPSVVPNGTSLDFNRVVDTAIDLQADQRWIYLAKGTGFDDTSKITAAGLAGTQTPMFASIRADDGTFWEVNAEGKLVWKTSRAPDQLHRTTAFEQAPDRNFWRAPAPDGSGVDFELDPEGPNPLANPERAAVFLTGQPAQGRQVNPEQLVLAVISKQDISTAIETKTRNQTISVDTFDAGNRVIVGGCSIEVNGEMNLKSVAPLGVSWSDTEGHNQPGFIIRYTSPAGFDATEARRTTEQGITQTTVLPVYSEITFFKEQSEEKVTDRLLITGGEKANVKFNVSKDNSNTCEVRLVSYNKTTGDLVADVFGFAEGQCWEASCAETGQPGQDTTLYNLGQFMATIPKDYFSYEPKQGQQIGTVSTWEGQKILEEMAAVIDADSYEQTSSKDRLKRGV